MNLIVVCVRSFALILFRALAFAHPSTPSSPLLVFAMSDSLNSPSSSSKKAPPFSALEVQSAQGSSLSFDRAEVIVPPRNKTEWLKCQLLTINWTNLALIIAVIAISSSIQGQLDNQRAENLQAIRASNELATMLIPAQQAAAVLQSTATLLAQVNATLALAVQLGFTNLTGQITELERTLASHTHAKAHDKGRRKDGGTRM